MSRRAIVPHPPRRTPAVPLASTFPSTVPASVPASVPATDAAAVREVFA